MPNDTLSYGDYLKAAFKQPYRIGLMGRMPLNQMGLFAFALLGLVNPGFWFLGAAAEVGYLAILSSNSRFQKMVQGERLLDRQRGADRRVQQAALALAPEARERYRSLGYLELAYAKQTGLAYAAIKNRGGTFAEPSLAGITAAAASPSHRLNTANGHASRRGRDTDRPSTSSSVVTAVIVWSGFFDQIARRTASAQDPSATTGRLWRGFGGLPRRERAPGRRSSWSGRRRCAPSPTTPSA